MPKLPKNFDKNQFFFVTASILIFIAFILIVVFQKQASEKLNPQVKPKVTVKSDPSLIKDNSLVKTAFSGTVVSINTLKRTLVVKNTQDNQNYNVLLSSDALISINSATSNISSIKPGSTVQIYSKTDTQVNPQVTYNSQWVDINQPIDLSNVKVK